jgi:Rab-GTPase-TBC domain
MHLILTNLASDFPKVSYYQGMNYLAIFTFYVFEKDPRKAYHFFSFMIEHVIQHYFGQDFQGVHRLVYCIDKLLERLYPKVSERLKEEGISAIFFCVPNLITLFTSMVRNRELYELIGEVWDVVLASGIQGVINALLLILDLQQNLILRLRGDDLMQVMRDVEKEPFAIAAFFSKMNPLELKSCIQGFNKKALVNCKATAKDIFMLEQIHEQVRKEFIDHFDGRDVIIRQR